MARKRSFTQMTCDYGSIELPKNQSDSTSPVFLPSKLKRKQRKHARKYGKKFHLNNNEKSNNYEMKHNGDFAYIDNPKPQKRQKVSHNYKCSTFNKPKIIPIPQKSHQKLTKSMHKNKILHQCILRDRYNLLTSPRKHKKPPNFPILSILNESSPKQQPQQEQNHDDFYSLHFRDNQTYQKRQNNEYNNYISSDTDSISSYETAYGHWYDDNIPPMSIAESVHTENSENIFNQNILNMEIQKNRQNTRKTIKNVHYESINEPSTIYQYQQHQQQSKQQQQMINSYSPTNLSNKSWNRTINEDTKYNNNNDNKNYEFKWNNNHRLQKQYKMNYDQRVQSQSSSVTLNDQNNSNNNDIGNDVHVPESWSKDWLFKAIKLILYGGIVLMMVRYFGGYQANWLLFCDIFGTLCEDKNINMEIDNDYNYSKWIILTIIIASLIGYCLINSKKEKEEFKFNYNDNNGNRQSIKWYDQQNVPINQHFYQNCVFKNQ